jgi:hypothetical protein
MSIHPRLTDATDHNATPFARSTLAEEVRELSNLSKDRRAASLALFRNSSKHPAVARTNAFRKAGNVNLSSPGSGSPSSMAPTTPAPTPDAVNLCAIVFLNGKSEGRFAMPELVLRKASAMPVYRLEVAVTRAIESAWLRSRLGSVELTAAGVYVAKAYLDLPR